MSWDYNSVGKSIVKLLSGVSGLNSRVYPMILPQGCIMPAAWYQLISLLPTDVKETTSKIDICHIQISVFDTTYSSVNTLAGGIRTALDGYSGESEGVTIDSIVFSDETDLFEQDTLLFHKAQDYFIRIKN